MSSHPGAGTTFRIYFPQAPEAAAAPAVVEEAPAGEVAASAPASGSVLLVEDDAMFRGLVREVLEAAGYEVLEAGDPASARALSAGHAGDVDVLVSDLVMPGGNGAELAIELRRAHPALRVILMSGYSGDALTSRQLDRTAADSFLEKPFPIDELLRRIRLVLDTERPAG